MLLASSFTNDLSQRQADTTATPTEIVDSILASARSESVSDVHLVPTRTQLQMLWRVAGVLHEVADLDKSIAANIVARLKVMANLLTYQTDVPQERSHSRAQRRIHRNETQYVPHCFRRESSGPAIRGVRQISTP